MNRTSEVSRRDLLKATVATTATVVAAPLIRPGAVAAGDPPPPSMRSLETAIVRQVGQPPLPARKLCRRLIGDDPPQSVVDAAAAVFNAQTDAPDQLAQVVRTVLLSEAFRTTWGEKIKRPFEATAAMLRATAADFTPTDSFRWYYGRAGQGLFQWIPPDGYPG